LLLLLLSAYSYPTCFALGSRLDRLLDERSVVPTCRGYWPLINLLPSRIGANRVSGHRFAGL